MHSTSVRFVAVLACAMATLAVSGAVTSLAAQERPEDDATRGRRLIEAYAASDFQTIQSALQIEHALTDLQVDLEAAVADAAGGSRRRLLAAALAVEAAQARGFQEFTGAVELIEWACGMLRKHEPPTEPVRVWFRASVAILEGLARRTPVELHAGHALDEFPDDPSFVLARAVAIELMTFPDLRQKERLSARLGSNMVEMLESRLRAAKAHDTVRAEAAVRLGYMRLRNGELTQALAELDEAVPLARDPELRYLAHLFRGRTYEALERHDDAVVAYRAAVAEVPGAQTAVLALAAELMRGDSQSERDEAAALGAAAVDPFDVADPWTWYGQGDLWLWPSLRQRLREAVR